MQCMHAVCKMTIMQCCMYFAAGIPIHLSVHLSPSWYRSSLKLTLSCYSGAKKILGWGLKCRWWALHSRLDNISTQTCN